jgi:hypothetical protein
MRFLPSSARSLGFDEIASLAVAIETFLPQLVERKRDLAPMAAAHRWSSSPSTKRRNRKAVEIRHGCLWLRLFHDAHFRRPVRSAADYSAKRRSDHKRPPRPIGNGVRAWIG